MRLGMPDDSTAAPQDTNRKAYDLLSEGFGPGTNGPLKVVVDGSGTARVDAAARRVGAELATLDHVADVSDPVLNAAGDTAIVSVVPTGGPSTEETKQLVDDVRHRAPALEQDLGVEVLVTGQTAVNIDVADTLGRALIPFLAIVVGLALVLLTIAFRSILVPLTAIGGFLLTIGAAFGGLVTIFQEGHGAGLFGVAQPSAVISLLPIIAIGILFGLAMDYQVFLVSRMREERVHGKSAIDAVTGGFRYGARVVTAAALIMVSVFSGFILEHDAIIKSVGFTLASGILIDAFVVRMTLIPAIMALLGDRMWWLPRWLDRILPHVAIDGRSLDTDTPAPQPVPV
jgi:RND superfamily putative drug exporter